MLAVSQHQLILQNKDGASVSSFAASPDLTDKVGAKVPVSQHQLIIQNKDGAMFSSSQHHLIIQNKDGANVSSSAASPDHTKQRWRQCWQFRSIT